MAHTTLPAFTPVPRLCDRSNGWKPAVQLAFIEALAETGSVKAACRRVGRSEVGVYLLRRHADGGEFRAAWDAALDLGVRRIEDAAMDRALYGTEETIHYHGEHVATRRRYNERLVMFILRNRAPERFTDGGAKGLNAVGLMNLKRQKKQWRAEWEAEREAKAPSPAEIRAVLDRKLAALKQQILARTSPVAYELEIAKVAQCRADEAAGWDPRQPYAEFAARAAELLPHFLNEVRGEWPPYEEAYAERTSEDEPLPLPPPSEETEEAEEAGPRVRTLKDEEW